VRILGDIDHHKVKLLQAADEIFISELRNGSSMTTPASLCRAAAHPKCWSDGDERTYEQVCALRAVKVWMA
jgi:GMP synthase PP-ATPase subunit